MTERTNSTPTYKYLHIQNKQQTIHDERERYGYDDMKKEQEVGKQSCIPGSTESNKGRKEGRKQTSNQSGKQESRKDRRQSGRKEGSEELRKEEGMKEQNK